MIALPGPLQVQLRAALHQYPTATWSAAAQSLSQRYRAPRDGSALVRNALDAFAYAAFIMPATYAQLYGACAQISTQTDLHGTSLLDLGSGPGTASWVMQQFHPQLQHITAVERDPHLQHVARTLAHGADLPTTTYVQSDITSDTAWPMHDIVVIGHVLNELSDSQRTSVIARAWQATRQMLLIVEPGAPAFFSIITRARHQLIDAGGSIVAPCTHHHDCPMHAGQWCHFGQKIARPDVQRTAKAAELGWEEAKYTFVACQRVPMHHTGMRLIHDPVRAKGYIDVVGCDKTGIHTHRIQKRDTQRYAQVRRAHWGSFIDEAKDNA